MAEEGKMSSDEVDVLLDIFHVADVSNVDIEDIGHEGALEDVHNGEHEGPHGDVGEGKLVVEAQSHLAVPHALLPWKVNDTLHDEEACHDELNGCFNATSDAVGCSEKFNNFN